MLAPINTTTTDPLNWANGLRHAGIDEVILRGLIWDMNSARKSGRTSGMTEAALNKLTREQVWALVFEAKDAKVDPTGLGKWLNEKFDPDCRRMVRETAREDMVLALLNWDRVLQLGEPVFAKMAHTRYLAAVNRFASLVDPL